MLDTMRHSDWRPNPIHLFSKQISFLSRYETTSVPLYQLWWCGHISSYTKQAAYQLPLSAPNKSRKTYNESNFAMRISDHIESELLLTHVQHSCSICAVGRPLARASLKESNRQEKEMTWQKMRPAQCDRMPETALYTSHERSVIYSKVGA